MKRSLAVLALAGVMAVALAGLAYADIEVGDGPGNTKSSKISWAWAGVPDAASPSIRRPFTAGNSPHTVVDVGPNPLVDDIKASVAVSGAMYIFEGGSGTAGENQLSSVPPMHAAGVGLFVPSFPPPVDSMLSVSVNRLVPGQVTLTLSGGGLQTRHEGSAADPEVTYRLIVYADQAAANADSTDRDGPALAMGSVELCSGALTFSGFLNSGDFVLQHHGGASYTARTVGTSKLIPGVNENSVVVVSYADVVGPLASPGIPAHNPTSLVLLTLGLMAAGLFAVRSYRRGLPA